LQIVNYTFLNQKTNTLVLSLFVILITSVSCAPDTLWDMSVEVLKNRLINSDYSFLGNIQFTKENMADVRNLGPGAYYYFSLIFSYEGYPDQRNEMLSLCWRNGKNYWKKKAGLLILENLLKEKKYKELEKSALYYLKNIKKTENLNIVKKMYIEALYWQEKDEKVLQLIDDFLLQTQNEEEKDPEIILFKAVAECRLNKTGWQNTFIELFLTFESDSVHKRAYDFIMLNQERFDSFDQEIQQLFLAKNLLGSGNIPLALPLVEYFLHHIKPEVLENSIIISELGRFYLAEEEYKRGLKNLVTLSKRLKNKAQLDAFEMAGRIARKDKDFRKGAEYLDFVVQNTADPEQRDRAAWFYLICVLEISPVRFTEKMITYAQIWNDPAYFDDIIQKGISILIAARKWETLENFFKSLTPLASNTILNQVYYLTARFISLGYFKKTDASLQREVNKYLHKVSNNEDRDYYTFLSAFLLGQDPLFIKTNSSGSDTLPELNRKKLTSLEAYVVGFFDFGLDKDGFTNTVRFKESLGNDVILYCTGRLNEKGYYKESIWLMNILITRKKYKITNKEMMYCYPMAFKGFIDKNAEKRGVFTPLLYALIREESAFDSANFSPVGAAGLTQLMSETAKDIAGWLRLDEYDLNDPETNILMGAYYFSRLSGVLDNIPKVLIAYNAGLGRLRSWEKEYKGLPLDLFIEAVPFRETRGYVKKIIVTAIIYSHLYFKKSYSEIFELLFPDMY